MRGTILLKLIPFFLACVTSITLYLVPTAFDLNDPLDQLDAERGIRFLDERGYKNIVVTDIDRLMTATLNHCPDSFTIAIETFVQKKGRHTLPDCLLLHRYGILYVSARSSIPLTSTWPGIFIFLSF